MGDYEAEERAKALRSGIHGGPLSFVCPRCGGDFFIGRRYIAHASDCPKYRRERERQDAERAALSNVRAPFPVQDREEDPDAGDRDDYILGGR